MRVSRLAVSIVAAAMLICALVMPAVAAGGSTIHLRDHAGGTPVRAAAAYPYGVALDSMDCYLDGATGTVVGDVRNLTDVPVRDIQISVRVEDAAGNVRSRATGSPWFEFLDPGEWSSFRVDLSNATGGTDCYADVTDWTGTHIPANQYFTASAVAGATSSDGTVTTLSGMLANNNTVSASEIGIAATLYDPDGNVVGASMLALRGTLTPGGTTSFSIEVQHKRYSFTPKYRIQAESTSDPQMATTMNVDPDEIVFGSSTDVSGKGIPGNIVRVQEWDQPTASWVDLGGDQITADGSGAYALSLSPDRTTTYRTLSGSVASVPVVLFIDAKVTLAASTKKTTVGKKVALAGTAEPVDAGAKAVIQRKVGSTWKSVATGAISSSGAFKVTWIPKAKGTYVLRAYVGDQSQVFAGASSTITIVVK